MLGTVDSFFLLLKALSFKGWDGFGRTLKSLWIKAVEMSYDLGMPKIYVYYYSGMLSASG